MGHMATIPLCPAHHREVGFDPETHKASVVFGKQFREYFGTDNDLLVETDRLIVQQRKLVVA